MLAQRRSVLTTQNKQAVDVLAALPGLLRDVVDGADAAADAAQPPPSTLPVLADAVGRAVLAWNGWQIQAHAQTLLQLWPWTAF